MARIYIYSLFLRFSTSNRNSDWYVHDKVLWIQKSPEANSMCGSAFSRFKSGLGVCSKICTVFAHDCYFYDQVFSHSNQNWQRLCRMFVSLPPSSLLLMNESKWNAERGMFIVFALY
jgi:hypothetical protein